MGGFLQNTFDLWWVSKVALFPGVRRKGNGVVAICCCSSFCFFIFIFGFLFDEQSATSTLVRNGSWPSSSIPSFSLVSCFFGSLLLASSLQLFFLFEPTVESYKTAYVLLFWVKAAGDHQTCFALGRMLTEMCLVRQRAGRHRRALAPFRFFREALCLLLRMRSQMGASHFLRRGV